MGTFRLGTLTTVPVSQHPELVSASVFTMLRMLDLADRVGVASIDPDLSDTAATQETYGLQAEALANCVIVAGRRDGEERIAACLVSAATRADVNGVVRRRLDVRKASFLARQSATESTGMEFGGITPIGLPAEWPVLIDSVVAATSLVVIGSGIRRSKLILPGDVLTALPGAEVVEGLGKPTS
jgi:prolyl-tRNA editing enzyme YbaK/EbsC (Cys-tRNA(Pro) deacylase)